MEKGTTELKERIRVLEHIKEKTVLETESENKNPRMELESLGAKKIVMKKESENKGCCKHDICDNLTKRFDQLEEKVNNSIKDQNKAGTKNLLNPRFTEIENSLKGMNLKIDTLGYRLENQMEELVNVKHLSERVANIEGWRISTIHGLNSKVIPAVAKLQRQFQGIQKRIDSLNKFVGYNKYVYSADGQQLTLMTGSLEQKGDDPIEKENEEYKANEINLAMDNPYDERTEKAIHDYDNGPQTNCFFKPRQQNYTRYFRSTQSSQIPSLFRVQQPPGNQLFALRPEQRERWDRGKNSLN